MTSRLSKERARPGCGFRRPAGKWDWRDANPDARVACAPGKKRKPQPSDIRHRLPQKEALIVALQEIQAAANQKFARSNPIKRQDYYIGKRRDAVGTVFGAEPSHCTGGTSTRVDASIAGAPTLIC